MHGVCQGFHAFPSAGRLAGRCVIRMLVVISRFCPAVQVHVEFLYSFCTQFADLFFSLGKCGQMVVFIRILHVEEVRVWLNHGLDALVYKGAADQVIDRSIAGRLFFQSPQVSLFIDVGSVNLAQIVVITVRNKGIS